MILPWRERAPIPHLPTLTVWTSLTDRESATLRELARGRRVLEIGAAFGYSTLLFADVAECVYSVDPHCVPTGPVAFGFHDPADIERYRDGTLATIRANLERTGLTERVTIEQAYSQTALSHPLPFVPELAFVDGDHSRDPCLADLRNCQRLMGDRGVIAVHDFNEDSCPGVREAVAIWSGWAGDVVDSMAVIPL